MCVEVLVGNGQISVRDSKYQRDPQSDLSDEPILTYTTDEWQAFVSGVKAGEFDL